MEVLPWRGKLLFGNSRLFHPKPFSSLSYLQVLLHHGTDFVASSDSHLANQIMDRSDPQGDHGHSWWRSGTDRNTRLIYFGR